MDFKFSKIQHVGIPCTSLNNSIAFYKRLGFSPVMQSTFAHEADKGHVCMMQKGEIVLEFYELPEPSLKEIKKRSNGHIDHIAFDVKDIVSFMNQIQAAGFQTIEDNPVYLPFWKQGCKYFYILGPDGERLEFCEIL